MQTDTYRRDGITVTMTQAGDRLRWVIYDEMAHILSARDTLSTDLVTAALLWEEWDKARQERGWCYECYAIPVLGRWLVCAECGDATCDSCLRLSGDKCASCGASLPNARVRHYG